MGSAKFRVSRLFVISADCASIALAQMLSYLFRFEFAVPVKELHHLWLGILCLIPFKIVIFYWFGLYRGMWRYTGMRDLQNLLRANVVSSLIIFFVILIVNRFEGFSRSVFLMEGILCFLFTAGFRVLIRIYYSNKNASVKLTLTKALGFKNHQIADKNTLLLGAGSAGETLIREIEHNPALDIQPVGFLDDDPTKKGLSLHGIPVLGEIGLLKEIVTKYKVEQIFLTMPSASANEIRRVVKECEQSGLPYKSLPGIGNLIDGSISIKDLRDVNYEDLLGRPPVELNDTSISQYIKGKNILVTGGGGSIGTELCRQIIKYRPGRLIILDHSEINLFNIDAELRNNSFGVEVLSLLGRVQDGTFLGHVFREHRPQIVFHAAAYKHVHLVERFPWEGVLNNVVGSKVLMEASVENRVERFVLVSTDKAVRPTNVMGASKRVTELLARAMNDGQTKFMAVRFGNVVGSSGSVVPFFRQQIRDGGPVTVTHPEATRYFMTIPEASKLILQAGAIGDGGEIFVLEMGTPVRIMQMAEDLIRLSGKEPYSEIDIVIVGLRDGEKIYEELITDDEGVISTEHKKIMVLRPTANGFADQDRVALRQELATGLAALEEAALSCNGLAIRGILKKIIPEYTKYEPGQSPLERI
ncbi:MAG: polysaccharide biosynthesis protein [Desulfarculaceae bacterium]|nr:polysaccharide biosynthesis protein [Desulfarculaceae bacterium]